MGEEKQSLPDNVFRGGNNFPDNNPFLGGGTNFPVTILGGGTNPSGYVILSDVLGGGTNFPGNIWGGGINFPGINPVGGKANSPVNYFWGGE